MIWGAVLTATVALGSYMRRMTVRLPAPVKIRGRTIKKKGAPHGAFLN